MNHLIFANVNRFRMKEEAYMIKKCTDKLKIIIKLVKSWKIMKYQLKNKLSETPFGESQAYIELPNKRSLEITHETYGLEKSEHFYSWRVHCSDEEFYNNAWFQKCGVMGTKVSKNLSIKTCMDMMRWAYETATMKKHGAVN